MDINLLNAPVAALEEVLVPAERPPSEDAC
jgi:hypothetical protein